MPSAWLTAWSTFVELTTKTLPPAAVGAEWAGALSLKVQRREPDDASSATSSPKPVAAKIAVPDAAMPPPAARLFSPSGASETDHALPPPGESDVTVPLVS